MRTIKLVMEYDGTGFSGWQTQPDQRTVQAELEKALARLTGEEISVFAAGRTDAGVHALGQVVSFRTRSAHPDHVFLRGLNALLPDDANVLSAKEAPESFHARKSAVGKWYRYVILERGERSSLGRSRAWHIDYALDVTAMREAAGYLIGTHDFGSFRSSSCEAKSPVKEMRRIDVFRGPENRLVIEMHASAFLKQMARAIAGTLVETGAAKRSPSEMGEVLAARDRTRAGVTAPAHGLYLVRVDY